MPLVYAPGLCAMEVFLLLQDDLIHMISNLIHIWFQSSRLFSPFEATFNILCDKYEINEFDETSTCREFPISFLLFDTDNQL